MPFAVSSQIRFAHIRAALVKIALPAGSHSMVTGPKPPLVYYRSCLQITPLKLLVTYFDPLKSNPDNVISTRDQPKIFCT